MAAAIDLYPKYVQNVSSFVNQLPKTNIHFIWRMGGDSWVSSNASVLKMNNSSTEYYIRPAKNTLPNQFFIYVHKSSTIKYLLSAYQTQSAPMIICRNAKLQKIMNSLTSSNPADEINDGSHLTFGLQKLGHRGVDVKVQTHITTYTLDESHPFIINTDDSVKCNFLFDQSFKNFKHLQNAQCFRIPFNTFKTMYSSSIEIQHIVHKLCKECLKNKNPVSAPSQPGGKPFFGEYKGVHFKSSAFYDFIEELFPLNTIPMSFVMIYDESVESKYIICSIKIESGVCLVYMNKKRIMKAAYARQQQKLNIPCTKLELGQLNRVSECMKEILATIFV